MGRRVTPELATERLVLSPLSEDDAREMVGVLSDAALYRYTGGRPPDLDELRVRYRNQVAGPRDSDEVWHNWVMRLAGARGAIGFVQATVQGDHADVAWVVAPAWQRRGYATEAARAMCDWLESDGVRSLTAHIHPDHVASNVVAERLGLTRTGEMDADGEAVWSSG